MTPEMIALLAGIGFFATINGVFFGGMAVLDWYLDRKEA
jgi:hypothetical protein